MIIVLIGVMGAGKTTVGQLLAARLEWPFLDADDFHPPRNIERLRNGLPLTDLHRAPWLAALRERLTELAGAGVSAILACSALRSEHRAALVPADASPGTVQFVYLRGTPQLLGERLQARTGHFAPATLLQSQLELLDEPRSGLTLDAGLAPEILAQRIVDALELSRPVSSPPRQPTR